MSSKFDLLLKKWPILKTYPLLWIVLNANHASNKIEENDKIKK